MRYRQVRYDCGNYLEVKIFTLPPNQKPLKRAKKKKETLSTRKKLNDKKSIDQMIRVANLNFGKGDLTVELTFDEKHLPATHEEVQKACSRYIRRVKYTVEKKYGKKAAARIKYLYVVSEEDDLGNRKRLHVHLLISGVDRDILIDKWDKGFKNVVELQPNENGITGKAFYMAKQAGKGSKRWIGSKNLKRPEVSTSDNAVTAKEAAEMFRNPDDRAFFEKKYRPWTFTDCKASILDYDGSYYIEIRMRKEKRNDKTTRTKRKE